jgi:Helix-turn-helix domain
LQQSFPRKKPWQNANVTQWFDMFFCRGLKMFTVRELQARFNVTEGTVLGWIKSGELLAVNVGRRLGKKKPRWRVTHAALEKFELLRSTSPPVPKAPRRKRSAEIIDFIH